MEAKTNMTAERSLEIITEQIERSRRAITRNSSWSLTWWGICVIVLSLFIAYLWKNHGGPVWNFLWFMIWPLGYMGEWFIGKNRQPIPKDFVGKTVGQVSAAFGIFIGTIGMILGLSGCGLLHLNFLLPDGHPSIYINITSIISLCFGIASTITGLILKNRVVQICGIIAGIGGFFCALQYPWAEQLYVMAAVAFIGLVIPGLVISSQNRN